MEISYTSKLFSLRHSLDYKLSIQASLNGFSFCVYDFKREVFCFLKHLPINVNNDQEYYVKQLDEIVKNEEIFSHRFRQVNFIYSSPNATVIPKEFAEEGELKNYFEFQHELHDYDELHYDTLEHVNSLVVYSLPSAITNLFLNKIKTTINYTSQYSLLIRLANDILIRERLSDLCFIHKNEDFFDILIIKDKKIELCNSFSYKTENDLVYYAISTLNYLSLADTNIPVYYSGNFHNKGQDIVMLDKFIKIFKRNEPSQIKRSNNIDLFSKYPLHYFLPLYFINY